MDSKHYTNSTSARLKGIRLLFGLVQHDMAALLGTTISRYKSLERKSVRIAEEEFQSVCALVPGLAQYFTFGGPIYLDDLEGGESAYSKLCAATIKMGRFPEGFGFESLVMAHRGKPEHQKDPLQAKIEAMAPHVAEQARDFINYLENKS